MSRYLDPKADVVFKQVFQDHPHLLKSFLNAILPLPADGAIVELTCLPSEQVPKLPFLKRTIADVRCIDEQGRQFIVEMQIEWTDSFKQRLLFEASQAYVKQLQKGEEYHLLQPVYGLGLVATEFDKTPVWYHHYQLVNVGKPAYEVIEGLQLVFVELPKFPIRSSQEKKLRLLWLRFMREIDENTREISKDLLEIPEISEAIELAEEAAYTPEQMEHYREYWDEVSREKTLLSGRYQEGVVEGEIKGIAKGMTEGISKIVLHMHSQGINEETIAKMTGLPVEEIAKILSSKGVSR
jgi:predicted transposase/invertase (TIGR01784 family)